MFVMKKIGLIIFLLIIVFSCRYKNKYPFKTKAEKLFYTDCGGMDYIRFPLIYPYEVMNGDFKDEKWIIKLQRGFEFYYSIYKVTKVSVVNDVIIAQAEDTVGDIVYDAPLRFFVLIPSKGIEEGFSTEIEFKNYLSKIGISEFKWWEVRDAYREFKRTGCLPWIPGCGNEP